MRIAVSANENKGLDSIVSHHFGRCLYYVLADLEERKVKAVRTIDNPFFDQHQPGQVPQFIRSHRAEVIITGGMGKRAIGFFQQYGIEAVTGASGTVSQVLKKYLQGGMTGAKPCRESNEHDHHHHEELSKRPYEKNDVEVPGGSPNEIH